MSGAAILGHDESVWAKSKLVKVTIAILNLFKDPSKASASGATVRGVKYYISADDHFINGKNGYGGVVVVKTIQSVIIGMYDGWFQRVNAVMNVERMSEHLRENGF
ncbi:unnamed protein product [Adineta ricciae]|uniref:Profilin n=1 Tax=Adineta ricciae TaxID=249248 RepID=A0A815K7N5_ADIRI|nr:unnamed protein product [Adineta ricciae]